jgi:nucleoside-diphosphate-sugar epimerase
VRVFITGGTGLVGRHVIAALRQRGDEVLALARSTAAVEELRRAGAGTLEGDLGDRAALEAGVVGADATVHAAAIVLAGGGWSRFQAVNVQPTEWLAESCARRGRRLVHLSSVAVYGRRTTYDAGPGSVTEDFGLDRPLFAGDHYARSKREAELALWRAAGTSGLSAVALRPCVIYGEGDRHFASRLARWMRFGVAPLVGDGLNPLAVVYAGNVASAVLAALDRPAVRGAFNVTNDGALSQRDFFERFATGLGVRLRFVRVPAALAWRGAVITDAALRRLRPVTSMTTLKTAVQFLMHPNPYVSDRARRELGWRPPTDAAGAVERTARWFRDA